MEGHQAGLQRRRRGEPSWKPQIEHTQARVDVQWLRNLLQDEDYVSTFGVLSGSQATQIVKAGLKAIHLSGWQVAGWHIVNLNAFESAKAYKEEGMSAYVRLRDRVFALEEEG